MSTIAVVDKRYDFWAGPRTGGFKLAFPQAAPALPSSSAKDPRLTTSHLQIDNLSSLDENWDGHGSARPNPLAIERARQFLEDVFRNTDEALGWRRPFISASEDGEVSLEWWHGTRKLTVYIGDAQSTFIKSWGPHIIDDMEDGQITEVWDSTPWAWLIK